jgi:phenylacetate-CoA ligase
VSELTTRLQAPFQLCLDHSADGVERMQLRCELAADIAKTRLADYLTLMTVIDSGLLVLRIEQCSPANFIQNRHSGKTPLVIDSRR